MGIVLDLIVILIIALFTFLGYKQGLVKAAIKIVSFFIAIIVALIIYKPVSQVVINKTTIDDNIKNTIVSKLETNEDSKENNLQSNNSIISITTNGANKTIEEIASFFSIKIIEIGTLLIIYIVIKIAIRFITILADLIAKLPLIKQINKLRSEHYMD